MAKEKYIIFDDFGSTAHKFEDQKQYIKDNVKFLTFNQRGWDTVAEQLSKAGFKNVTPDNYQFFGIPLAVVDNQKYQCIGWFDENYGRLYIKGAEIRSAVTDSVINKQLGRK